MGGSKCDGCRSWVEDIYWNHFQFVHFAQFLPCGYDQLLALPKTFSDNLKKKLPENVFLKGPSGVVWSIGVTSRDDILYFVHGWAQFVKDQSLKENDFLVFKFNGESQFEVLIFDGGSFCEKASSYFVRKCTHAEIGNGCFCKKRELGNSLEEGDTPSNADVEYASPDKSVHHNGLGEPMVVPSETPSEKDPNGGVESAFPHEVMADQEAEPVTVPVQKSGSKRLSNLVPAVKHVQTKRRGRGRPPRTAIYTESPLNWVPEPDLVSAGKSGATAELFISQRRPVTENEVNHTLQLAKAACSSDSLLIVMRPTHVYKRFYVSIPCKWLADHIVLCSQDVMLRSGRREWLARFSFHTIRCSGGLTGGWKHFTLDNNLEEFDVCVFKPAGRMNDKFVMDVSIFRVVEELVPPLAACSSGKKGRKPALEAIPLDEV